MNLKLKRGLITQSLSPVFVLLVIRHFHCEYTHLICRFFDYLLKDPCMAMTTAWCHEMLGELLIFFIGILWIIRSLLYIPAFAGTQNHGFHSHGEQTISVEEKRDAAASFLMTFILPLLIDELTTPQYWISYLLVIVVVYAVLYQSNLYYQSPVLAILKYHVNEFKVLNPDETDPEGFKNEKIYIGITRGNGLTDDAVIKWKKIADDVYLIYNE